MSLVDFTAAARAAEEAEQAEQIAQHARLFELAAHNGLRPQVVMRDFLPGKWWQVPAVFVPIVGCMLARVE